MQAYIIVDIVLLVMAAGILLRCWKHGLVASVIRLVGTIAAYAGAWLVSKPVSIQIYDRFVHSKMLAYAGDFIPADLEQLAHTLSQSGIGLETAGALGLEGIGAQIGEQITQVVEQMGFSPDGIALLGVPDSTETGNRLAEQVLDGGSTIAEALVDLMIKPMATLALQVLVFFVVFWLLSIVVSVLFHIGVGFNELPLIGGANRLMGLAIGLAEAAILFYITCFTLEVVALFIGGRFPAFSLEALERSRIFSMMANLKLPGGMGIL